MVNNQNIAISSVNSQINSLNSNINQSNILINNLNCNLTWVSVQVETVTCKLKDGIWTPETKLIGVMVLANSSGNEVSKVVGEYHELANANREICEAKNKNEDCPECYAAVPDSWLIRPEHHRPQAVYQFAEINNDGEIIGSPKYSINIPHHKPQKPNSPTLPVYRKGNWEIIFVLSDNSKITIHALNQAEGYKVLNAAKSMVYPKYLIGSYLSKDGYVRTATPLAEIRVKLRMIKYFPQGRKDVKPEWIAKF